MANNWLTALKPASATKPDDLSTIPDYFGTGAPSGTAITRLAKIPGADPAVYQQFLDAEELRKKVGQTTGDYFSAFDALQPKFTDAANADLSEIDQVMNPMGYQSVLQGIRQRRAQALGKLDQVVLGDLRRTLSSGQLGSGGGGGINSYLARIAASEAAKVRANEAFDAAGQERTDTTTLAQMRAAAAGKRSGILDSVLARLLQPADVANKSTSMYGDALSRALQQALLNSMLGVASQTA